MIEPMIDDHPVTGLPGCGARLMRDKKKRSDYNSYCGNNYYKIENYDPSPT
jgi:hypothetical protein